MPRLALKSAGTVVIATIVAFSHPLWAQKRTTTPSSFGALAAGAAQAREAGRPEEAIGLYRRALSLRPRWAEGWWYLGTLLYDRDAYAEAAAAFKRAAAVGPKVGSALVMLGLCEFNLGRRDKALEHIQQGRRLGTIDDRQFRHVMLYHEGLLLLGKGEFERAQETLGLLSRDGVESEDLITDLGLSVLRIRPADQPPADSTLGELVRRAGAAEHLAAQKEFAKASREYERMSTDFPRERNVHYALGRFLIASRDADPARIVAAFQREIENSPDHVPARLGIAAVKGSTDPAGGLPYAEEAVRLSPALPLGHYLLGFLLLHTDQTERAITELETAQRSLSREPRVYYALGRAYARAGRKRDAARARAIFQRLSTERPESESATKDLP